jgi:hypothetical protein
MFYVKEIVYEVLSYVKHRNSYDRVICSEYLLYTWWTKSQKYSYGIYDDMQWAGCSTMYFVSKFLFILDKINNKYEILSLKCNLKNHMHVGEHDICLVVRTLATCKLYRVTFKKNHEFISLICYKGYPRGWGCDEPETILARVDNKLYYRNIYHEKKLAYCNISDQIKYYECRSGKYYIEDACGNIKYTSDLRKEIPFSYLR